MTPGVCLDLHALTPGSDAGLEFDRSAAARDPYGQRLVSDLLEAEGAGLAKVGAEDAGRLFDPVAEVFAEAPPRFGQARRRSDFPWARYPLGRSKARAAGRAQQAGEIILAGVS